MLATIDQGGFTLEPLDPSAACTPTSVAAHMLYETVDPFRMREPAGTLVATDATHTEGYATVADEGLINEEVIARLYGLDPADILIFASPHWTS
ncbi:MULTISPECIES: hypothetical protein [unclassified Nonomuraea]|uniref:hypothetical protein n=1 Tax=unclassified Nonomuraea TaxID=2593643 RepID=UPI00191C6ABD|nr:MULTISPECIES: hypothetical protein [unclassified Nonomuraea]